MAESRPRVVRKRARAHDEHHGGAWKVAYADLVTALMAFFLVMWLISQGPDVRESVAAYFSDPIGFQQKAAAGSGMMPGAPRLAQTDEPEEGDVEKQLEQKAIEVKHEIEQLPEFDELEDQIIVEVGPEGLRIQLLEAEENSFFDLGSAKLSPIGEHALGAIAKVIGPLTYEIALEGHTDSKPYPGTAGYTNWELSADRANAARRVLTEYGVDAARLAAIRGYADTRPRFPDDPLDPRNRRIEILVLNPALSQDGESHS